MNIPKQKDWMRSGFVCAIIALSSGACTDAFSQASAAIGHDKKVLGIASSSGQAAKVDLANAKALPLPRSVTYDSQISKQDSVQVLASRTGPASD